MARKGQNTERVQIQFYDNNPYTYRKFKKRNDNTKQKLKPSINTDYNYKARYNAFCYSRRKTTFTRNRIIKMKILTQPYGKSRKNNRKFKKQNERTISPPETSTQRLRTDIDWPVELTSATHLFVVKPVYGITTLALITKVVQSKWHI